jgi:hypothetical protein
VVLEACCGWYRAADALEAVDAEVHLERELKLELPRVRTHISVYSFGGPPGWSSQMARVPDGVQASPGIAAIAARMSAFMGAVTENRAPPRRMAPITAALQNAESIRAMIVPVQPAGRPSSLSVTERAYDANLEGFQQPRWTTSALMRAPHS